jgi:ABC-type transport system involved in multi-copper enzyme maturation permease subunit
MEESEETMSTLPQTTKGSSVSSPLRRDTVVMGRADFLSVVLRLIGVELYKLHRRSMSKVLIVIGVIAIICSFIGVALLSLATVNSPVENYLPPSCAKVPNPEVQTCLNHPPTARDLEHARQLKRETLVNYSAPLRLPESISTAMTVVQFVGLVLITILAGTIVGGEYHVGTIRLMFTRGPTRTQFLFSKVGVLLVCCALGVLGGILIGVVWGAVLNFLLGVPTSFAFFSGTWLLHLIVYLLVVILGLFVYAMLALCLSTLGRATAAGVAGALVWWVMESILSQALGILGQQIGGAPGQLLRDIPDYFIGKNISVLVQNQGQYLFGNQVVAASDLQAVLVLTAYLVLFSGLAWWANEERDITN